MLKQILKQLPLAIVCVLLGLWGASPGEFFATPKIESAHAYEGALLYVHKAHGRHSTDAQYVRRNGKDYPLLCGTLYHGEHCPMLWYQHNSRVRVTFNEVSIGAQRFQLVAEVRNAAGAAVYENTKMTTRTRPGKLLNGVYMGLTLYLLAFFLTKAMRQRKLQTSSSRNQYSSTK